MFVNDIIDMIEVEIDKDSGFCFGVVTAIESAERELGNTDTLYCLGDIVHNSLEVERLEHMGLHTIDHDGLSKLRDRKVLLRAHGEPPSTYSLAKRNNITIIDATCPVVLRLQRKIHKCYQETRANNTQLVIYGKKGHAEVNGLVGQTEGTAIVIEKIEDLDRLDFTRAISLFSQTTKSLDGFKAVVAEIKLRNINKEYILKRVAETSALQDEIEDLEDTLAKPGRIRKIIITELEDVKKKYAVPRRTEIVYSHEMPEEPEEDPAEDYPVHLFLSREGYFKKITPKSLRMSGEQKYKEGDGLRQQADTGNNAEIMFFTDRCQVYKTRVSEFGDSKASVLGDYLPGRLAMDEGERVIFMVLPGDYSGCLLFFYENGKAARVELSAYATVSNRRKLTGAYSDKSPLVSILPLPEDRELALASTEPRALLVHTSLLAPKTTRNVQGVAVMTLKPKYHLDRVLPAEESGIVNLARYRTRTIPAAGAILKPEDRGEEQLTLL